MVLETAVSGLEQKVALLEANRPPRTLTPMDEARVVQSMRRDDVLGPKGIAHVLGRKPSWVTTRLTLADRLSEAVVRRVDTGTVEGDAGKRALRPRRRRPPGRYR